MKANFLPRLKALHCISASIWGPSKKSLSFLYKAFLRPLLTYTSLWMVSFSKSYQYHQIGTHSRTASRAITSYLSSSPIPLLLSEASLPPLRVTLTHFALSSHERALRLTTSFFISDLARLGVRPTLCRSSWRAFASTHPLMIPSTSPTCLPFLNSLEPCLSSL